MSRFPRWWFWAAVTVPAVITAAGLVVQAGSIERRVADSVRAASPAGTLVVDGRDVTITGIPAEQIAAAQRRVEAAAEVRSVSVVDPELMPMRFTFRTGTVVVSGTTGQQAWRTRFVQQLAEHAHGRGLVDETKTERGTDFPITTEAAETLVALFSRQPEEITVGIEARRVTVAGVIQDDNRRKAIIAVMRRLFGDSTVIDRTEPKE